MSRVGSGRDCAPYGLGEQRAKQKAHDKAVAAARQQLEIGCEPVPCPECGLYQPRMVQEARRRRLRWMSIAGRRLIILLLAPLLFGFIVGVSGYHAQIPKGAVTWYCVVVGALAGLAVSILMIQKIASSGYDPNSVDVEGRKRIGRSRARLCK